MPTIIRWNDLPEPSSAGADMADIFFDAGGRTFAQGPERDAFFERWLGRYLAHDTTHVWLALDDAQDVIGYLAGALDDPARAPRFADIDYFQTWAALTARYPAHLHINLRPAARGAGVGQRLVEAFCEQATAADAPGVHVVTGAGARNISFYRRCGFEQVAAGAWNGHDIVMLAKRLSKSA